jgi:hypothetical protein
VSLWRGRGAAWDPDREAIEQERQRWVYEQIEGLNEAVIELTVDPDREYARHVAAYVESGDEMELRLALEYVRCPG